MGSALFFAFFLLKLKSVSVAKCCQVKENQEEIHHEEKERNFIPHLRALRGEKFLIVQHLATLPKGRNTMWLILFLD